jgi:hypothetical protein
MHEREDWLAFLQSEYKIHVVRDGQLVSLKYNMIDSPMDVPIVQQCRGMVVDTTRKIVLAWPYNKFWNHGEGAAAPIDWTTARVQEKLDGSLMLLYWNGEAWAVASSGHPTAGGSVRSTGTRSEVGSTFRDLFWKVWNDTGMRLPDDRFISSKNQGWTFMFELCAAENRIIVKHEKPQIILHGARDFLGVEISVGFVGGTRHGWPIVNEYALDSIESCLTAAETLEPFNQEGFVVVDTKFNRVKIKSPKYVALHHLKGEFSLRRAIELWQTGETSELFAHFPEVAADIEPIHAQLNTLVEQSAKQFEAFSCLPSRKEFALQVKDLPNSSVLFRMHSDGNSKNAAGIMRRLTTAALERMLQIDT